MSNNIAEEGMETIKNFDASQLSPLCTKCQSGLGTEPYIFVFGKITVQFCSRHCMNVWCKRKGIRV